MVTKSIPIMEKMEGIMASIQDTGDMISKMLEKPD